MNFLSPTYWFTMQPPEVTGGLGTALFVLFVLMFVHGIIGRIVADKKGQERFKREIGGRVSTLMIVMGVLGMMLYFFSFERAHFFGARFWYPTWGIFTVIWVYHIVQYVRRDIPAIKARSSARAAAGIYLPKSKKRKKKRY